MLWYSSNISIVGNNITSNGTGMEIAYSSNNNIVENNITNNSRDGILLYYSSNNSIAENNIANNWDGISSENGEGIWISSSSDNSIVENTIANNYEGIELVSSSNNKFCYNNFLSNIRQVYHSSYGYANVWDDGYPSGGNYWSDYTGKDANGDGIGDTPCLMGTNNRDKYPLMKLYPWGPHDIGITSVATSKTVVGQGENLTINIRIFNYGNDTENFNVTAYANTTIIDTLTDITLTSRNSVNVTFTWSTIGAAIGNYTISAYVTPVPSETDTIDNTYTGSTVKVATEGDLNADGTVDILDISIVAVAFDSNIGELHYNPDADINGDNKVDILDISIVAIRFGE